jgi:lipopolysaccharide transport system permease protein
MSQNKWTTIIRPQSKFLTFQLSELLDYNDLLLLFVKRNIVTVYKQTILGPLWYVIQPLLTTMIFTFVFGKMAKISTDGIPHVLFYLSGVTFWGYFAECLNKTSNTFVANQSIFGKVYFPRIIIPLSIIISNLGKLFIQISIFVCIWLYYFLTQGIEANSYILFMPVVIINLAILSLGLGMIFSALTTKYRDLSFLLSFGVQLLMYATPIIYPMSILPEKYFEIIRYNPIAPLIEVMRLGFLGKGSFDINAIFMSSVTSIILFVLGLLIFNKTEKTFMDTV